MLLVCCLCVACVLLVCCLSVACVLLVCYVCVICWMRFRACWCWFIVGCCLACDDRLLLFVVCCVVIGVACCSLRVCSLLLFAGLVCVVQRLWFVCCRLLVVCGSPLIVVRGWLCVV